MVTDKKRKISAVAARALSSDPAKPETPAENVVPPPAEMSAFAAARARATGQSEPVPTDQIVSSYKRHQNNWLDFMSKDPEKILKNIPKAKAKSYRADESASAAAGESSDLESDADIEDDDDEELTELQEVEQGKRTLTNFLLSLWRPTPKNVLNSSATETTLQMHRGETVCIVGTFDLTISAGTVAFYGTVLRFGASVYRVYCPSTHALPDIQCTSESAVVKISTVRDTMEPLEKLSPSFGKLWNGPPKEDNPIAGSASLSYIQLCEAQDDSLKRPLAPLMVGTSWQPTIDNICNSDVLPQVLVAGPRHSGKSTFCKLLLNRLLVRRYSVAALNQERITDPVFYLDLDATHPEYTPPGQISLILVQDLNFGPPYTHPSTESSTSNRTIKAHAIPRKGAAEHSEYFYACAVDLMAQYQELSSEHPATPLIINTPPWSYMDGLELLLRLIRRMRLSNVVYLTPPSTSRSVRDDLSQASKIAGATLHEVTPQQNLLRTRTDKQLREMQMLSYFHQSPKDDNTLAWDSMPLSYVAPLVVGYSPHSPGGQGILGILTLSGWVSADQLHTLLNGSIVHIIHTTSPLSHFHTPSTDDDNTTTSPSDPLPRAPNPPHLPYIPPGPLTTIPTPDPATTRLVCPALLRSFDRDSHTLHLLIPEPSQHLVGGLKPHNILLAYGCADTPGWAYLEDPYYDDWTAARGRAATEEGSDESDESDEEDLSLGEEIPEEWRGAPMQEAGAERELPPWVMRGEEAERLGRLNITRKVRKFQK